MSHRIIQLTDGRMVLIDSDEPMSGELQRRCWRSRELSGGKIVAVASVRKKGDLQTTLAMHRLILGVSGQCQVQHLNGNGLDNRRHNLKVIERRTVKTT